ncbi:hypothetical protein E1264_00365 [Actinomadura sp. KC216]|uniref:hypothetical protein n=1 Tax=Actinomadura sp. KC216 TaxID=2530370 RepID=UPI00104BA113|nr:hypothetical protein [Actinomadura sp. KC216]TDB91777.1 hypothetical protein E1264_00365 [Actinomadura sp. KC216]
MRLVSVIVLGTGLIAAGMLAPGTGDATDDGAVLVDPDVAHPGQRVDVSVPQCVSHGQQVMSEAFTRPAKNGTATIGRDIKPGTYTVVASCGGHRLMGEIAVSRRRPWPTLPLADR